MPPLNPKALNPLKIKGKFRYFSKKKKSQVKKGGLNRVTYTYGKVSLLTLELLLTRIRNYAIDQLCVIGQLSFPMIVHTVL